MGKSLIISEKPSVCRDITEALGGFVEMDGGEYYEADKFICTYAVGHILGLCEPEDLDPAYKRWRLADLPIIPEEFRMKPLENQKNRVKVITQLMARRDVDTLINACDAAREGELIFREIVRFAGCQKPIKRLWLQSMTKDAIRQGFVVLKDGKDYEGLAAAAECRAYSDWLIGMNATRAFTVRLKSRSQRGASWSAGRVQTPTLALLVNRELEVLSHIPRPFWRVQATFQATDHAYEGTWFDPKFAKSEQNQEAREDRIFDEDYAKKVVADVAGQSGTAAETRKEKVRKAPLLLDLTSAQKEANRRFGWSAKRTLGAAQRCYEAHKVLTYPRTSSRVLPEDYVGEVEKLLVTLSSSDTYGRHAQYLIDHGRKNDDRVFDDKGVSDHFAIIPTGVLKRLEGDDLRFFDLVTRQFLAVFYPPAIYEEVERITVVQSHQFRSRPPQLLKSAGWQAVFEKEVTGEEIAMPPLVKGKDDATGVPIKNNEAQMEAQETKPPARIGEAGLLGLMENAGRQVDDEELSNALQKAEGLGTAATRADIIENLKTKEYVDQSLRPTVKGIRLIDILKRIKADRLTSAELTARLELHLNEVEDGKRTAGEFMSEVADYTREVVEAARNFDYDNIYPQSDPLGACPKCGREVYERAWFYGCVEATKNTDAQKECDFLIWKDHYGRYIDRQTVLTLLSKGETGDLDGFRTQSGKTYKAVLAIESGQLVRRAVSGEVDEGAPAFEVNTEPLGPCPIHVDKDCQVVETATEYTCMTRKQGRDEGDRQATGFSFPRMLCKREMRRDEVIELIGKGETQFLTQFISKKGRPFSAKLKLEPTGRFTFEFPERVKKSDAGGEAGGDEAAPRKPKGGARTKAAPTLASADAVPKKAKKLATKKAAGKKTASKKATKAATDAASSDNG